MHRNQTYMADKPRPVISKRESRLLREMSEKLREYYTTEDVPLFRTNPKQFLLLVAGRMQDDIV